MLSAFVLPVLRAVTAQMESGDTGFFTSRPYYAARLIGALLIATLVPFLIDRHARSSGRVRR
jgi:hypothetical protein